MTSAAARSSEPARSRRGDAVPLPGGEALLRPRLGDRRRHPRAVRPPSHFHPIIEAAAPPSPRFVLGGGLVYAVAVTLLVTATVSPGGDAPLRRMATHLPANLAIVLVSLAIVFVARLLISPRQFAALPARRAFVLSYGVYALAGAGAAATRSLLQTLVWPGTAIGPGWWVGLNVAAGIVGYLFIGFAANQYHAVQERVQRQHALLLDQIDALTRQAHLLDLTPAGITVYDMDGRVIFWNQGAEATYGWTRARMLGQDGHAVLQTRFPAPFEQLKDALLRDGIWEGELVQTRHDGRRVTVASRWVVQRDDAGAPIIVLEIDSDITERLAMMARIHEQQEALRGQVSELQRSRELIIATEENLRREIAELLHGRVQSRLLIAWHRLGLAARLLDTDPEQARALLAQARDQIDEVREHEVREASHLLHPSIIHVGLVPALHSMLDRLGERPPVHLRVDPALTALDDPADNQIPETVRLVAYRVVEEGISNIYKHAQAGNVYLSAGIGGDGALELSLRDDGRGFDPAALKPGLGLNSIAGRVEQAGGRWSLTGAPGRGTTLAVRLPLTAPPDAVGSRPVALHARDSAIEHAHQQCDDGARAGLLPGNETGPPPRPHGRGERARGRGRR